ncbi:MAG: hypothetical protein WBD45_12110 [Terriglobales bacterium]
MLYSLLAEIVREDFTFFGSDWGWCGGGASTTTNRRAASRDGGALRHPR